MVTDYYRNNPISFTTILREYPFPDDIDLDIIRKTVKRETDIFFYGIIPPDQISLAITIALISARLSNQTAMIVVRTSKQARKIYNNINSEKEQSDLFSRKHLAGIKIASTFSKFKGNSQPLAANKLIITSYSTLLRTLLYRKCKDDSLKKKVQLPIVDAYIFVDPLDENKSLNSSKKSWSFNDIDSLFSLLPRREKTHIRKHYISTGLIPIEDIEIGFRNITTSSKDSLLALYHYTKDNNLQNILLRFILVNLYSGSPSKKDLLERLMDTIYTRIFQSESKKKEIEMQEFLVEQIFQLDFYQGYTLFDGLQKELLGPFSLVTKDRNCYSRFTLTEFGKKFLIASTYFKEILNNPIELLTTIRKKTENDIINWSIVQNIFSDFTKGQLQFDDLQLLLGILEPTKEEEETIAEILRNSKNSYMLFQVTQLANCFREQMTQQAKDKLRFLDRNRLNSVVSSESSLIMKMDRRTLERFVKELLINADYPLTLHKISSMLVINTFEVTQAIQDLITNGFQVEKLIGKPPKGRSLAYYSCKGFPNHYNVVCGDCHWYVKKRCTFWQRIKSIAERMISDEDLLRITETLRSNTIGCEHFQAKESVTKVFTIEEFNDHIPKSFSGQTLEGEELLVYLCPDCFFEGREVVLEDFGTGDRPTQGLIAVSCPVCNTTFKLIQKRKKTRCN